MGAPLRMLLLATTLGGALVLGGPTACTEHGMRDDLRASRSFLVWEFEHRPEVGPSQDVPFETSLQPVTRWVTRDLDGSLRELGRRDGLWVVADGTLWNMAQPRSRWRTRGCDLDDEGGEAPLVEHESVGVTFEGRDGRTHRVIDPVDAAPGAELPDEVLGDFSQHHQPIAGFGSLLIFQSTEYGYACGAHGGVGAAYLAYDLQRGAAVDLVGEAEALGVLARQRREIVDALVAKDAWEDGEISLTAVYPRVVGRRLTAQLQFTAESCYACSDGNWHSYTVSTRLESPQLPPSLAPHGSLPGEVAEALGPAEGDRGFGWSEVPIDGPLRREVARAFDGQHPSREPA